MKKALVLPFLQLPSGHHQSADAIIDSLRSGGDYLCEKVDIFSYSYRQMERLASRFYITWISFAPSFYNAIYEKIAYKNEETFTSKRFPLYERLFLGSMERLIKEKNPQIIFCTHALPSYLLNELKKSGRCNIPVINVYTDFFANQLWGLDMIDLHFAPCLEVKHTLINRGVDPSRIVVTGIPVHAQLKENVPIQKGNKYTVLITGGNLGTGSLKTFIQNLNTSGNIHYLVLCGKNKKLYRWVKELKNPFIHAYPYIASKREMNTLYCSADLVITKPGGVTVSECLYKKLPIIIYHELPGQEMVNLQNLKNWGLVYQLKGWEHSSDVEQEILKILQNEEYRKEWEGRVKAYHERLYQGSVSELIVQFN